LTGRANNQYLAERANDQYLTERANDQAERANDQAERANDQYLECKGETNLREISTEDMIHWQTPGVNQGNDNVELMEKKKLTQ
jgi:hypothetical protein